MTVPEAEAAGDYLVWNATLDGKTTPQCAAKHGHRWNDGWFLPPPAHFNCRSTLIRVSKKDYVAPAIAAYYKCPRSSAAGAG